jgi:DNA-binding NarL/FixJ family response regulator
MFRFASRGKRGLTAKVEEVLARLVTGSANREITQELAVSEKTAVNDIFGKLRVARRLETIVSVIRKGLK